MRHGALILVPILAACSGADERAPDAPPTDRAIAAASAAPAPATAIPVDCGDASNGGYDNAKACYYATCNKGDAEACRMAESFNGNVYPDGDPRAMRLEDMAYPEAREVILGMGWIPAGEDCGGGGTGEATCSDFPEIDSCSGTGMGFCAMTFRRGDRCLDVVTTEGAPERGVADRPFVKDVSFRKGPCRTGPDGG
jgi:hypothetical protein